MPEKFQSLVGSDWQMHQYPKVFCVQKTTGPSRICFSTPSGYVDILLALSSALPGPFHVLYVLLVSRRGNESGRYQSPELSRAELQDFLERFENFFEQDGRHHIWIHSIQDNSTLVYDNHNVVYAYGPTSTFTDILIRQGFQEAEEIRYPAPHSHKYNLEFDDDESEVLKQFDWKRSQLREQDDP